MNCEVVAVGTELLLGPSVDTNSTWIGEKLAENGINSHFHTVVGDNRARIVQALRLAIERSDAVIVTGGLGPTADDITRDAIAEVMGVQLELDADLETRLKAIFAERRREMSPSNLQQAWRPTGATAIPQTSGTAPGLICPVGNKVIYAVPGVPSEMKEMVSNTILGDLRERSGATGVILSRFLCTWGVPESVLGEMVAERVAALETIGNPTIAFLAHGINGIHIRITAHGADRQSAIALLDREEADLRGLIGPLIFGVDDATMESVVGDLLIERGWTIGVAESLTGGLIASRLAEVPGASQWFNGAVVSYASQVKHDVLDVPVGPVLTAEAAQAMADGARRVLKTNVAIAVTGVAGPTEQEGQPVGTVFVGLAIDGSATETLRLDLSGNRQRIRAMTCINALNELRIRLLG